MVMELIEMEEQIITENRIRIHCGHTSFANHVRIVFPNINELEKDVKEIRKKLRDEKVILGKTNTLKLLKESKEEYNQAVKEYNQTFDKYLVAWTNKMHIGMYTGYIDDEYFNDVITPLNFKLIKMNYRDTILSKVYEIHMRLNDIKNDLEYGKVYNKLWI